MFTLDLERALLRPRRPVTSCEQNNNRIVNNTSQRIMAEFYLFSHFFHKITSDNWHTNHNISCKTDDMVLYWLLLHRIQSANVTINGISTIFTRLISLDVFQNTSTLPDLIYLIRITPDTLSIRFNLALLNYPIYTWTIVRSTKFQLCDAADMNISHISY